MSIKNDRQTKNGEKVRKNSICNQIMETKMKTVFQILLYSILVLAISFAMSMFLLYYQIQLSDIPEKTVQTNEKHLIYWVYTKKNETGYLKHVHAVLERLGFQRGNNDSDWDFLWAHDYPFRALYSSLKKLKPHQRVNHFPGCGYITNKVNLSTSKGKFIPVAFKLPEEKLAFLRYAEANRNKSFVQKLNDHRGIRIHKIDDIEVTAGHFVQEFIDRPYLIDGYKFDIGVYTTITSIDPLRVYVYKGDVLFRFCPVKYYPFDPENLDKYVVGDDYLPIWQVPSLSHYYTQLGFSMKDSFDAYIRSKGRSPKEVWNNIYEAIREITLMNEGRIKEIVNRYGNTRNFFELLRIDFTLDEDLNVYTMEANMSPNLSSAHFPSNQLLYEQVIFNFFSLVGIGQRVKKESLKVRSKTEEEMQVASKNLVVFPDLCTECKNCFQLECQLCKPCFTAETKLILSQSYLEHQNKMDFLRIFPYPTNEDVVLENYTLKNQLLIKWYQGKCKIDHTWCT